MTPCLLISLLIVATATIAHPTKENSTTTTQTTDTECSPRTPCGWAVYFPYTRKINYFMKNTCYCGPGKACLRTGDDISVNAYVHRCIDKPPHSEDTEDQTPYYPTF